MSSVNKVIIIGNLGQKPELKFLPSGSAIGNMSIATTEKYEKDGQKQEKTEWHRVVMFGKTAENCAQYLDKGRSVYVEGKLQTRTWDDKTTGEKRYMTEIVAQNVTFLGGGEGKARGGKSEPAKEKSTDHGYGPAADDEVPF